MKNEIKIIFVDIDWTLLNHKYKPGRYDKSSIRALKRVQKKGIKVFVCTARPYHSVEQVGFFNYFKPDGIITGNGGLAIYGKDIIYGPTMDQKEFEDLCELAISLNVNLEFIRPFDAFLIAPPDEAVYKLFQTYPENIPEVKDYHNQKVIGCCLFAPKELDEVIRPKFPKDFYYYRYHDYGVDIASIPHIKGEAVKVVLDYFNIDKEHAMAIGDDDQDISMFDYVKFGVAMGNAKESVKQAATFISKDIDHHGVKFALKNFI